MKPKEPVARDTRVGYTGLGKRIRRTAEILALSDAGGQSLPLRQINVHRNPQSSKYPAEMLNKRRATHLPPSTLDHRNPRLYDG